MLHQLKQLSFKLRCFDDNVPREQTLNRGSFLAHTDGDQIQVRGVLDALNYLERRVVAGWLPVSNDDHHAAFFLAARELSCGVHQGFRQGSTAEREPVELVGTSPHLLPTSKHGPNLRWIATLEVAD